MKIKNRSETGSIYIQKIKTVEFKNQIKKGVWLKIRK